MAIGNGDKSLASKNHYMNGKSSSSKCGYRNGYVCEFSATSEVVRLVFYIYYTLIMHYHSLQPLIQYVEIFTRKCIFKSLKINAQHLIVVLDRNSQCITDNINETIHL